MGAPGAHHFAQALNDFARLDGPLLGLGLLAELGQRAGGNFVAAELSQQLLLGRQIQILVRLYLFLQHKCSVKLRLECSQSTHPDALHVEGDAVCRDALVVRGLEDVVFFRLVNKPPSHRLDLLLEFIRRQNFMRQRGEREVKVVRELDILQLRGFRQAFPDTLQVGGQRSLQIGQRRRADVVADDK